MVLLPYSVLLHQDTRESLGIKIDGQSVILDEAHNVVSTINELYSPSIDISDIESIKNNVDLYINKYRTKINVVNLLSIKELTILLLSYLSQEKEGLYEVLNFKIKSKIDRINIYEIETYMKTYNVCAKIRSFTINNNKKNGIIDDKNISSIYKLYQLIFALNRASNVFLIL